ncbi:MAG: hypothetical protein SOZ48_00430 [Eubacterium sp.]|nr:hypothetical protein [Eubacterium sp.]
MQDDTIKLLRECNSGIKMGISSLDDVIDDVQSGGLREILKDSREIHCRLGSETHQYLIKYNDEGKEPAPMAKAMAKIKSNFKTMGENPDPSIASLITDGCNMGIKSLYRYLNQYPAADKAVKHLAKQIIDTEEKLLEALRQYL